MTNYRATHLKIKARTALGLSCERHQVVNMGMFRAIEKDSWMLQIFPKQRDMNTHH